jgi:hypothetical protein
MSGILARLLDILLPSGGYTVQLIEAYFDESGSHEGSPVLCVAGYIIEKDACVKLDSDWAEVLEKFKLPFFRMSSCAHGTKPFDVLAKPERIEVEKQLIAITRQSISYGIAITVEPKTFEKIIPASPEIGSAYSVLAHACLTAVKSWANETQYAGDIAYFFESGHKSQSEANAIMERLFRIPKLRADHRYASHTFADKQKVRALQAADFIAWQWFTDHKRRMERKKLQARRDCYELMKPRDDGTPLFHALHYEEHMLRKIAGVVLRGKYPLTFIG